MSKSNLVKLTFLFSYVISKCSKQIASVSSLLPDWTRKSAHFDHVFNLGLWAQCQWTREKFSITGQCGGSLQTALSGFSPNAYYTLLLLTRSYSTQVKCLQEVGCPSVHCSIYRAMRGNCHPFPKCACPQQCSVPTLQRTRALLWVCMSLNVQNGY